MKKYGLLLRQPQQKKPPRPPLPTALGFGEEEEDDVEKEISRQAAKKKSLKDIEDTHKKALEEDPSVFDYDGVYDEMKQKIAQPKALDRQKRESKYIKTLMGKAEERKRQHDVIFEKNLAKERIKDDHLFADKDKFVTAAYKRKLAEQEKWMEEERLRELREEKEDVTKKSRFDDDTKKSSSLVLDIEQLDSGKKTNALVYTPFVKNPKVEDKSSFSVYYYLGLRRITIDGHHVKMPYKYLSPGEDGNGGVIIDSATTFTFIAREAFEPLSDEFIRQITDYKRIKEFEDVTGLGPCFNVSDAKTVSFPELRLYFKGGADVALPVENYFAFVGGGVACLTMVTGPERVDGPGMILGSFQMQNFYVEYDLRNERLGFKQEKCK